MHKPNLEDTAFIWHDKRQHKSTDGFQRESLLEKHDNRWQHKVSICLRRVGSVFIRLNWFRFTAWELNFLGAAVNVGNFVERPNTPLLCPRFGKRVELFHRSVEVLPGKGLQLLISCIPAGSMPTSNRFGRPVTSL